MRLCTVTYRIGRVTESAVLSRLSSVRWRSATGRWSGAIQCYGKPKRSDVKPSHGKVKSGFVKYGYCIGSSRVAWYWYGQVSPSFVLEA